MTCASDDYFQRNVSRETQKMLSFMASHVEKWNGAINLVSKGGVKDILHRHILDSLQLANLASEETGHWADLGSGGGFPGIVIAIYSLQLGYPSRISLVESDLRKCIFLREIVRELHLPVSVHNARIEALECLNADVVSARALAPLTRLCGYAHHHLAQGGTAIFPKGANYASEIIEAEREWRFSLTVTGSLTSEDAAILSLKDIKHV